MFTTIGNLLGGLGLLLIGMSLMTDGLKLAAGNKLRDILALWTNTRLRGLFSGFLITGIVQSSSAVTVATIGFANAGMLSLNQSLWVIFGSNVGTTMTGWIVALIGFKVNIDVLALPLIGIGALLKLTGGSGRRSSLGLALVGFGLLFFGIDFLKSTFESLSQDFSLPAADGLSFVMVIVYVGVGFMLTTLMQSSSASMVVALSAAESGLLPLQMAAAVVIGANLGTTTTAILSVFGATPTAKRVALGHVGFNVITALVAIILLAPMLWLNGAIQDIVHLGSSPSVALAIFHTCFNILGVVLMWPLAGFMTSFLQGRFLSQEESESKPKFLDKNTLALPYIAIDALNLELSRIATRTIELLQKALHNKDEYRTRDEESRIIRNLSKEVGNFASAIYKTELTSFIAEALLSLMHATQEYMLTVDISEEISQLSSQSRKFFHSEFQAELDNFITAADSHLDSITPDNLSKDIVEGELYKNVEKTYDVLKKAILVNASFGNLDIADVDILLQYVNQVKRGCRHLWKASRRLNAVRETLQRTPEGTVVESDTSDKSNIEMLQDTAETLENDDKAITPQAE